MRAFGEENKDLVVAAGGFPTPLVFAEVSDALSKGVIQGVITNYQLFEQFGRKGIIGSLTWSAERSIFSHAFALITGERFWNRTGGLQPILLDIGRNSASNFQDLNEKAEEMAIRGVRKAGVKVVELAQDDFNEWEDLARKTVWQKFVQSVRNGEALVNLALQDQGRRPW